VFKRHNTNLRSDAVCLKAVNDLTPADFQYYDKDGFELNLAEQKYYRAAGHPIHHPILNHTCYQEPWFELERDDLGLILDHSLILHRCNYNGAALDQLRELQKTILLAQQLINTVPKWGFDFDLNAVAPDGTIYEVLHVEYDHRDYTTFKERAISFEYTVRHTDWIAVADMVWQRRAEWQPLKGFEQNHWRAREILSWNQAEYLEKAN
jgi:hypothetical protein